MAAQSFADMFKSKAKEAGYGSAPPDAGSESKPSAGGSGAGTPPEMLARAEGIEKEIAGSDEAADAMAGAMAAPEGDDATKELGPDGPKMVEEAKTMPRFESASDADIIKALKSDLRLRMRIQEKVAAGSDAEMESEPAMGGTGMGMGASGAMPPESGAGPGMM